MHLLGSIDTFSEEKNYSLTITNKKVLLVHSLQGFHLIENKCGHFEAKLTQGWLEENSIVCPLHGISFSLETGKVVNRPYENCEPIIVFDLVEKDNSFYTSLTPYSS